LEGGERTRATAPTPKLSATGGNSGGTEEQAGQDQGSKEKMKEAEKYLSIKELRLHGSSREKID
jgi:hypothetical protein